MLASSPASILNRNSCLVGRSQRPAGGGDRTASENRTAGGAAPGAAPRRRTEKPQIKSAVFSALPPQAVIRSLKRPHPEHVHQQRNPTLLPRDRSSICCSH